MNISHDLIIEKQFGQRASDYVESAVHANGADLRYIAEMARQTRPNRALDLGAGGGHVSYHMAPHSHRVTACDMSIGMIDMVRQQARSRGLDNIEVQVARAECLPFPDACFDFLACRFSAHHWQDFYAGLDEARRVMSRNGRGIFIDIIAPENPVVDSYVQAMELLRDHSHVRDYRETEWLAALTKADFTVHQTKKWRLRMDFASWVARMGTSELHIGAIRSLQANACEEVRRHLEIEEDGSFTLDVMMAEVG